ncbi:unnamed protein product [Adineta ricciae]|uniref:Transferase n=1 Tax=Adineta ricciae TaxID=249248 RepID=A0A815Y4J7_ADIRI|nr:unnamed protein product [Adineta ricciae]
MTIETYTIYPTKKYNRPPPPSRIVLHGLDLLSSPIHILNHRFYRPPTDTITNVIDKLKFSLAEALELYPPAAGTVRTDENGEVYIALDAENISGTPFLVEMRDTPFVGDSEDLSPRTVVLLPPLSSTLAVKVTQFSCGTIAVASSMHHQVADLCGFLDFLELWAQLARSEPIDLTKIPDDWSRTPGRFFPDLIKESSLPTSPPPPFTVLSVPQTEVSASLLVSSDVTRWKFTKNAMERLKLDFSPSIDSSDEYKSDLWISSGDALAALLCGVITRARENGKVTRVEGRSHLDSQTEIIAMAADGRERAPQRNMIDGQYFGNFNTLWSATISRSDLSSLTCEAASHVALAIRNTLKVQLSPEAIAHKISFFEDPQNNKPIGRITWSADIILTNWCRFDLQGPKLDFGWGKPFSATSGAGKIYPSGYCVMMQEKSSGDVLVLMTVEQEGAEFLKTDLLLNKYATMITIS